MENRAEDEAEGEAVERSFLPPPSTAPATLQASTTSSMTLPTPPAQVSRAGRKRAPTVKALEAEKSTKRGGQRRGG